MTSLWRGTISAEAAVEWHRTLRPLHVEAVSKALDDLKESLDFMPTHRQLLAATTDTSRRLASSRAESRGIAPPAPPRQGSPAYAKAAMAVIARQRAEGGLVDGRRHVGDHEGTAAEMERRCPGCAAFVAAVEREMGQSRRPPADDGACHRCGGTGWKQVVVQALSLDAVAPCNCSRGKRIAEAGKGEHTSGCSCFRCRFGGKATTISDNLAGLVRLDGPRPVDRTAPSPDPHEAF